MILMTIILSITGNKKNGLKVRNS